MYSRGPHFTNMCFTIHAIYDIYSGNTNTHYISNIFLYDSSYIDINSNRQMSPLK